jgi:RHS repeat-associated protein
MGVLDRRPPLTVETREELPGGIDYLNNRHYDPTTGVFLSVDPLVAKTMQPYIYGAANPATMTDPTGLDPDTSATNCEQAEKDGGCTYSSRPEKCHQTPNPNPNYGSRRSEPASRIFNLAEPPKWIVPSWNALLFNPHRRPTRHGKHQLDLYVGGYFIKRLPVATGSVSSPRPVEGCGWACGVATGVTALGTGTLAAGGCVLSAGFGCAVSVVVATGVTSVVYEATSTDGEDGGDLVCAFVVGPSDPYANATTMAVGAGSSAVTNGANRAVAAGSSIAQDAAVGEIASGSGLC